MNGGSLVTAKTHLPLAIMTTAECSFVEVGVQGNIVEEVGTKKRWQSHSPGVYIGQPYYHNTKINPKSDFYVRYLALSGSGMDATLTLQDTEPLKESNQALPREFLAGLAEVVKANKIASPAFVTAVEQTMEGVRATIGLHLEQKICNFTCQSVKLGFFGIDLYKNRRMLVVLVQRLSSCLREIKCRGE